MKLVTVYYRMTVYCHQEIKVPNEFKMNGVFPDEIEEQLFAQVDFKPNKLEINGLDYDDYEFDFVSDVDDASSPF
jgi:hypothetical protein